MYLVQNNNKIKPVNIFKIFKNNKADKTGQLQIFLRPINKIKGK